MKKKLLNIAKYIWQLPQNLVGLLIYYFLCLTKKGVLLEKKENNVFIKWSYGGSMSLGRYIFLQERASESTVIHELNHCNQSLILGPLYLLIIGLPSIIHCGIWILMYSFGVTWDYYSFYTEHWMFK